MRTPREMLETHRDAIVGIDWEFEGTVALAEQVYALEDVNPDDLPLAHFEALVEIINDEVDDGMWPIEFTPEVVDRRLRVVARATVLLAGTIH